MPTETHRFSHDDRATGAVVDTPPDALAALRRFARSEKQAERCELCATDIAAEHQHLIDTRSRKIACSCDACAILFCGQEGAKYRRVPRRIVQLNTFAFTDHAWTAMALPINLAFFVRGPSDELHAFYPSPAGPMESLLSFQSWVEVFGENPSLKEVEPEVEALLVNRIATESLALIVPIDICYRLVGLIRTKWRGLSGGPEVWQAIAAFFAGLEAQATHLGGVHHA